MKAIYRHRPKQYASLNAYYEITTAEKAGRWNPEVLPEIDWVGIEINGCEVDEALAAYFIETFGAKWESQILNDYGYNVKEI